MAPLLKGLINLTVLPCGPWAFSHRLDDASVDLKSLDSEVARIALKNIPYACTVQLVADNEEDQALGTGLPHDKSPKA